MCIWSCETANFCSSSALGRKEFLASVAPYNERANFIGGSGISELFEVLEELSRSGRSKPTRACPDRRIDRIEAVNFAHGSECELWTLSPSDVQFDKFLADIGSMVPQLLQTKRRLLPQKSNLLSVVTLVRIGPLGILLGLISKNWVIKNQVGRPLCALVHGHRSVARFSKFLTTDRKMVTANWCGTKCSTRCRPRLQHLTRMEGCICRYPRTRSV
jgi:hypothetical protein